jgi:hypothetical protein
MKYVVRAIKYFFYFSIMITIIMVILVLLNVIDSNIETMFKHGYNSLWQIALMFAVVSAFYPLLGFVNKPVLIPGEYSEIRNGVVNYMEEKGYILKKEEGEDMTFILKSKLGRISRMWEDQISMKRELAGFRIEGLRKDVVRIAYGLEYKFRQDNERGI